MKELYPMVGVIPAMNVGFTEDDRIDLEGLEKHTQYAVDSGVAGLLIPVVATEVSTLTPQERADIIDTTVKIAKGKAKIIGGATATSKELCVEYVRKLMDAGCDGVLASIPYENEAQYFDYIKAIDDLHPDFLMIQDYALNADGVPVDVLVKAFDEFECFKCIKTETKLTGPKFTALLEGSGGRMNVSGGWSITQYIEGLDRGVHAMVPTAMHEIYCKLDSLYRAGFRAKACKLYQRIQPIIAFSNQDPGISIHFYKRMLYRMGMYATDRVRVKTLPFDKYYQRIADDMIDLYFEVSNELKSGLYD